MGLDYAYTNARVKGMKSNLLGASALREMMQVATLDEIVAILEQSPYKQDLVRLSSDYRGLELIDRALHENFVRTIKLVLKNMPASGRKAFEVLASEWLAEDIRKILSKKALGEQVAEGDLIILNEKNRKFFKRLIAARSVEETIAVLASGFGSKAFKTAVAGEKDFRSALIAVDKELSRELSEQSKKLDLLSLGIIRKKAEFHDALVVLRLKKEGLKNSAIAGFLLSPQNSRVKKLLGARSLAEALDVAKEQFGLDKQVVENAKQTGNLVPVEVEVERSFAHEVFRATRISVLSFATILGFFYLKSMEVENVRKIAFANQFGLKEEMAQFVFAVNK